MFSSYCTQCSGCIVSSAGHNFSFHTSVGLTVAPHTVQVRLLRPTGLLVVRTVALSAPLALASALAARTDGCAN